MGILVQVIATVILCFSCVNMSISMVWPSSTILLFQSVNTTLHRPMTDMDVTLFSSLGIIGTLITQPLMIMFVLDKQGLKRTAILSSMFFVIGWAITAASNRVEAILLAVILSGCGNATFLSVTMFVSEIAQDSIRGILTAGTSFSLALGVLISYFIGGLLEYHMMVYSYLSSAVIGVAMIMILKESPVRLMAEGKVEEAAKSLAFYRQTSKTSKEVLNEIVNIQRSLNLEREDAQPLARLEEQTKPAIENKKMSCWQLFKSTPSIRRQFYLVLAIETAFVCQGMPFMQVYAEPIFTATVGDDISPNLCSVIFGLIMLITGVIAAYLSDEIGRRPLQIYSCLMCGVCSLCLGTQIVTEWFPSWTTLLFIYVFAIAYTVGAGTVSYVIVAEIFLPEVKSRLMMITNEWGWICAFSCMFLLSIMTQSLGYASAFFVFSIVSFATATFYYFFLPETKALPVYAIQALFNN